MTLTSPSAHVLVQEKCICTGLFFPLQKGEESTDGSTATGCQYGVFKPLVSLITLTAI